MKTILSQAVTEEQKLSGHRRKEEGEGEKGGELPRRCDDANDDE